jgi:hypothetical protein
VGILVTTGPARDRGKVDGEGAGAGVEVRLGRLVEGAGAVVCGDWLWGVVVPGDVLGDVLGDCGGDVGEVVVTLVVSPDGLPVGVEASGEEQADRRVEDSSSTEVSRPLAAAVPTRWFVPIPRWCVRTRGRGERRRSSHLVPHWVPTVPPATASTKT